jgi:histone H3/H4
MPISKQTIREIASKAPGGISRVSQESVDLLNGIVDRVLSAVFPKDSSVVLRNLVERLTLLSDQNRLLSDIVNQTMARVSQDTFPVPHDTVRRMIREHAGDVKVPEDTIRVISHMIEALLGMIIYTTAMQIIPAGADRKLEGKHIVEFIAGNLDINLPPFGPLDKPSRKSKSRKSKKRCSKGKRSVRGFKRSSGKKVKAYCRKK